MNRAQYNITDDRFKFWPAERLSPSDYAEAKACKFQWFPGQKCFSAIWRPQAEDFLARMGVEIEDVCEVDDVAARVERFDRYAAKAEETAQRAADRLANGEANTRRRAEGAERVAVREFGAAAHWQRRIAGAISAANYKENPGAILRRIETLEKDLRRHQLAQQVTDDSPGLAASSSVWVGGNGRGQGHWIDREKVASHLEWEKRWSSHIEHRLEYERARLAATGHTLAKLASNEIVLEVGGAIKCNRRRVNAEGWYYISKLNPASVEIYAPHSEEWRGKWLKVPRDEIGEVATAAQVKAGEVQCDAPPTAKPSSQPKGTQQGRDGKTPEKFGAFGSEGGFSDRIERCTWFLITKVNRSTVEYLSKQQFSRPDRSTYWSYYIKKTDIRGLSFIKTPAEVKAGHADLLADWAKVEELRAAKAAREAAQPAEATA